MTKNNSMAQKFFFYSHLFGNLSYLCRKEKSITDIMTSITVHIPNKEIGFFKKMMERLGWSYQVMSKPQITDPETGDFLNEKTMNVIEDARNGKGIEFSGSIDEFKQWAESL